MKAAGNPLNADNDQPSEAPFDAGQTLAGIGLLYTSHAIEKLSLLVATIMLARWLPQEDFGLIATILLILSVFSMFRDIGITDALIYKNSEAGQTADAAFWLLTTFGTALALLVWIAAPAIAWFLGTASDFPIILCITSLALPLEAVGMTHWTLLRRQLLFKRVATVQILAAVTKTAVIVMLVISGWGLWSLTAGFLAGSAVRTLAFWLAIPWRPRARIKRNVALDLISYGRHTWLNGLLYEFLNKADQIAVIMIFGEVPLGYFYLAARISEVTVTQICIVLTTVLFPTIATLHRVSGNTSKYILNALRYISYGLIAIGLGIAATAPTSIPLIFGEKWIMAVPFAAVIAVNATLGALFWIVGDGLKATGRPDVLVRITAARLTAFVVLSPIIIYFFRSPLAICYAATGAALIGCLAEIYVAKEWFAIKPMDLGRSVLPAVASGLVMVLVVQSVAFTTLSFGALASLSLQIAAGAIVYLLVLWLLDGRRLEEVAIMLFNRLSQAADKYEQR